MILKKYSDINEIQFAEYISDWETTDEKIVPSMVMNNGSNDSFEQLMIRWKELDDENTVPENMVPATLYYLVNDDEKIIGARAMALLTFRHWSGSNDDANRLKLAFS